MGLRDEVEREIRFKMSATPFGQSLLSKTEQRLTVNVKDQTQMAGVVMTLIATVDALNDAVLRLADEIDALRESRGEADA